MRMAVLGFHPSLCVFRRESSFRPSPTAVQGNFATLGGEKITLGLAPPPACRGRLGGGEPLREGFRQVLTPPQPSPASRGGSRSRRTHQSCLEPIFCELPRVRICANALVLNALLLCLQIFVGQQWAFAGMTTRFDTESMQSLDLRGSAERKRGDTSGGWGEASEARFQLRWNGHS